MTATNLKAPDQPVAGPNAVVVGAGPAGLACACLLAMAGWSVEVLEKLVGIREGTRAPTLWPPALMVLQDIIGVDGLAQDSQPLETLRFIDDEAARTLALGAYAARTLPQWLLEQKLASRAAEVGVAVTRGTTLVGLGDQLGVRTEVVARDANGMLRLRTADLVVGADGANSTVRALLGIGSSGLRYDSRFALLDFVDSEQRYPRNCSDTYTGAKGALVSVPLPDSVVRVVAPLTGDSENSHDPLRSLRERAAQYGLEIPGEERTTWSSVFAVSVSLADSFGEHSTALIGDAAHVQSPAGGRGMNNAIEDAFTLASSVCANPGAARKAVAEYAAVRRGEMSDELDIVKTTTAAWLRADRASNGAEEKPRSAERPKNTRSQIQATACLYPRPSASGGKSWDSSLGTRISPRPAGRLGWPPRPLLVVGAAQSAAAEALPQLTGMFSAEPSARRLGDGQQLPSGVYHIAPSWDILRFWPFQSCADGQLALRAGAEGEIAHALDLAAEGVS